MRQPDCFLTTQMMIWDITKIREVMVSQLPPPVPTNSCPILTPIRKEAIVINWASKSHTCLVVLMMIIFVSGCSWF